MGFMQQTYGIVRRCWVTAGQLYYAMPYTDKIHSCEVSLDIDIPEQLNEFRSDTVAFYLMDDNFKYIGRYDGTISILDKNSGMLVDWSTWKTPAGVPVREVGKCYTPIGYIPAYMDMRDEHTVYTRYMRMEGSIEGELKSLAPECIVLSHYRMNPQQMQWMILDKEENEFAVKEWSLQKNIWSGDCPRYF